MAIPTLGGRQFWTDQFIHGDWRIQQRVRSGKHRLLDPRDQLVASGDFAACREVFDQLKADGRIAPLGDKAAVLLHGLGRTRRSMNAIARNLQQHGYTPINMEYASTRAPIQEHAAALQRVVSQLEGVQAIYFVGHSMGNIVWRYYLREQTDERLAIQGDPRIKATVMIAPPNQGAYLARLLKPTGVFGLLTGRSGQTLASNDWQRFAESLAIPNHRFAIIAGKFNGNPVFRVDNDTTVSVDETRLSGAADFLMVRSMHAFIMNHSQVIQAVESFFSRGYLVAADRMQPIP